MKVAIPLAAVAALSSFCATSPNDKSSKPNILFIFTDDLGAAELGCTGSTKIRTPHLDQLREQGMLFTQAYSGSTVCAPSRCTLLTGRHTGHAQIRDNGEQQNWDGPVGEESTNAIGGWQVPPYPEGWWGGQRPLVAGTQTIGTVLQENGYQTACIGKWGLGGIGTSGEPNRQGFDHFFGYNCQRHAHNYYPRYLERNGKKVLYPGNDRGLTGETYAADAMLQEALWFLRQDRGEDPFFLYYATPVPHLALQVPEDSLEQYSDWEETPYKGKSYLPHDKPRAAYAGMVSRMDRDVGALLKELEDQGVADNTIVIFTSDNGSTFKLGGYDMDFFEGTGGLRGTKGKLFEGGIRVPLIVKWPGEVQENSKSSLPVANWDFLPTLASLTGSRLTQEVDGIDLSPELTATGKTSPRSHLYWEYYSGGVQQAVRMGKWKGYRGGLKKNPEAPVQLFNLETDPFETSDCSAEHPEVAAKILLLMTQEHKSSPVPSWNLSIPAPAPTSR
ncbi:MAG: arylsulfatase [Planctomycetes bacterium]|nr:arylsulfatase [Planctomycetota bacterium]